MSTFAFIDGHWSAADLITPGFLIVPAVITPVCCYLVLRNRRLVSYSVGIAAIPAVLVLARMFWATLQFDLRDYPREQLAIALTVAFFPFLPIAACYFWRARRRTAPSAITHLN